LTVSIPADLMSSYADVYFISPIQNVSAALLSCVSHGILVDVFHYFYLSLCDNISVFFDARLDCIVDFPVASRSYESYVKLTSISRLLAYYMYLGLQSDFAMLLHLLYRNIYVRTVFMFCVPQEDPHSIVYL
jgi:hypothetical protein